jgi:hypothetical protein
MFNIVKRGDLMLGRNVTKEEAEKARLDYGHDDYGRDYAVVEVTAAEPDQNQRSIALNLPAPPLPPAAPLVPSVPPVPAAPIV